jgi:hypothetical protein
LTSRSLGKWRGEAWNVTLGSLHLYSFASESQQVLSFLSVRRVTAKQI